MINGQNLDWKGVRQRCSTYVQHEVCNEVSQIKVDSLTPAQISPVRVDLKDPPSPAVCEQRLADHDIHGKTCPGADRVVRDRSKASRTRCTKCPCGKIDFEGLWFWVGDLRSSWWTFTPATRVYLASRRFVISAFAISAAIWFWTSNDLYSISSSSLPEFRHSQ